MLAQGSSLDEAKKNLFEVVGIQFEEMKELGQLDGFLEEMGFSLQIEEKLQHYQHLAFYYDDDGVKTALGSDSEVLFPVKT